MQTGYFLAADLLGFRNIVRNSSSEELAARVTRWTNLVDGSARSAGLDRVQLISDTVFVAADDSPEGLQALIQLSRLVLSNGVRQSLPIRGGICHGSFNWGRLTYGPAVIAAHELEAGQNWVGVSCDTRLPHLQSLWGYGSVVAYAAPQKAGPLKTRAVVDWDVPATEELMGLLGREGLMKDQDVFTWELGEKVNNTIQFRIYKELAKRDALDPAKFWGLTAMQVIEACALACSPSQHHD